MNKKDDTPKQVHYHWGAEEHVKGISLAMTKVKNFYRQRECIHENIKKIYGREFDDLHEKLVTDLATATTKWETQMASCRHWFGQINDAKKYIKSLEERLARSQETK